MNVLGNVLDVRSLAFGATGSLLLVDGYTGAQRFDVSNLTAAAKLQDPPGVNTGAKRTTINEPLGIAQDASGSLYVADAEGFKIFDAMATGDTAPKRTLTGAQHDPGQQRQHQSELLNISSRDDAESFGRDLLVHPDSAAKRFTPCGMQWKNYRLLADCRRQCGSDKIDRGRSDSTVCTQSSRL